MRAAAIASAAVAVLLSTLALGIPGAAAESPTEVAEELAIDGVFVGIGRNDVDEEALIAAVDDARFDGLRVVAVVPRDPQPTAAAYARRIQEQTDADAALVFPREGRLETYVVEDLSGSRIRATEAARQFSDPARAVEAFATEVTSTRETGTPEIVTQTLNALVLMTLVVGIVVALEQGISRLRRPARAAR
jgi:hypothetical protein